MESEAAAIASERASTVQIKAIKDAQRVFIRAISGGERGIKEDFAFHQSIALATQNNRFAEFLEFLGRLIIPRQSIRSFEGSPDSLRKYLGQIEKEHEAISQAIAARLPKKARDAMRGHLLKSRERVPGAHVEEGGRVGLFTSPRVRGEVGLRSNPGEGGYRSHLAFRIRG